MSLSADKLKLHAVALAEAVRNRAVWLAKVKDIRNHQQTETAEGYAVTLNAYRSAKRQVREAVAAYDAARAAVSAGNAPGCLDEATAERLKMYGWDF